MEQSLNNQHYCKGDVVRVPFPYSDLTKSKHRPVLIIGLSKINLNVLLITKETGREYEVILNKKDFDSGNLPEDPSYIRIDMIATLSRNLVTDKPGTIKDYKLEEVITKRIDFISQPKIILEPQLKAIMRAKKIRKLN